LNFEGKKHPKLFESGPPEVKHAYKFSEPTCQFGVFGGGGGSFVICNPLIFFHGAYQTALAWHPIFHIKQAIL